MKKKMIFAAIEAVATVLQPMAILETIHKKQLLTV